MNSVVVLSQNLWFAMTFSLGDGDPCWSKWCGWPVTAVSWWSTAHSPSLKLAGLAASLSPLLLSGAATVPRGRAAGGTTPHLLLLVASLVTATAYVLLKGKEEGRQEVRYMGMLKNLKNKNLLLCAKCLRALAFCQFLLNPQ